MIKSCKLLESFNDWWYGKKEVVPKAKPKRRSSKRKYTKKSDYWKKFNKK